MANVKKEKNEEEQAAIGKRLAEDLGLKIDTEYADRWETPWGTKTSLGIYRTFRYLLRLD